MTSPRPGHLKMFFCCIKGEKGEDGVLKLLIKIMMDIASVMAEFLVSVTYDIFWLTMSLAKEQESKT